MARFEFQNLNVTIRNPQLGDTLDIGLRTMIKEAMDGTIYSYVKTPVTKTWNLTFNHLNRPKILEVFDFINNSAGQEVFFIDESPNPEAPNGIKYLVKILTKPESPHEAIRNSSINMQLEMLDEGTLVPGP